MKLSEALYGIAKVIETEGDLDVERTIITEDEFGIVIEGNFYKVDDYDVLIKITD